MRYDPDSVKRASLQARIKGDDDRNFNLIVEQMIRSIQAGVYSFSKIFSNPLAENVLTDLSKCGYEVDGRVLEEYDYTKETTVVKYKYIFSFKEGEEK